MSRMQFSVHSIWNLETTKLRKCYIKILLYVTADQTVAKAVEISQVLVII